MPDCPRPCRARILLQVLGEVQLVNFYNDGGRGTGTAQVGLPDGCPAVGTGGTGTVDERCGCARLLALGNGRGRPPSSQSLPTPPHPPPPQEMALPERASLAFEGVVVAAVDVFRAAPGAARRAGGGPAVAAPGGNLRCRVRVTTRGMWLDKGKVLDSIHQVGGTGAAGFAGRAIGLAAGLRSVCSTAVDGGLADYDTHCGRAGSFLFA